MTPDLATLRRFFASAPFMADLGIEPFEVAGGAVSQRGSRCSHATCTLAVTKAA